MILLVMNYGLSAQEVDKATTQYDFWLGDWNLTWDDGNGTIGKGTNRIQIILDGVVIQENFEALVGQLKGFKGTSISVYNPTTKQWKQAWADNQGSYFNFVGEIDGDKRIFKTQVFVRGEKKIIQRMVFYDITHDKLTWDWEKSEDGGTTWQLQWRINYERAKE